MTVELNPSTAFLVVINLMIAVIAWFTKAGVGDIKREIHLLRNSTTDHEKRLSTIEGICETQHGKGK